MIVLSPVLITIPSPLPSEQRVPKKARLSVSRAFSGAVHSVVLNNSLDSPVKEELLTLSSEDLVILTSAGILSPLTMKILSPGTKFFAGI
jgi:flagellar biosynthesis protein FliR